MSSVNPSENMSLRRERLGRVLLDAGLITQEDLANALDEANRQNKRLGETLVQQGKINREQLGEALATRYNLRYVNISKINIDEALLEMLPEEFIVEKQVIPVASNGSRLVVAMVDPMDRASIDEITFLTGMRPQVVITTPFDFQEMQQRYFSDLTHSTLIEEIASSEREQGATESMRQQQEAELTDQSNPLVKLVNSIIEEAIQRNASDIHIEPRKRKYVVRFRIDGILKSMVDIPQNMENSFVTRIKVMARLDIAEHRRPQDGRFGMKHRGVEYNLRVNTLPVGDNREKIVIRILRPSKNITDFQELGFDDLDCQKLQTFYESPYGMVLVCGPTGSGKTTTLYTILNKMNEDSRNISTVEDPIELNIEGLNQSQVNTKAEYTFASSMRALLRQDPDVIMVGEIRDLDTLEAAIHAALTGHLVFSTIHSNTASATITRMMEMGASVHLISSALLGVIAQRLLRKICPHCRKPYHASNEEKLILFPDDREKQNEDLVLYRGEGCELCGKTGYLGRDGVYEILVVDRDIRQLISNRSLDFEVQDAAIAGGMRPLAQSGRQKVLKGISTLSEVVRVLGKNLSI